MIKEIPEMNEKKNGHPKMLDKKWKESEKNR